MQALQIKEQFQKTYIYFCNPNGFITQYAHVYEHVPFNETSKTWKISFFAAAAAAAAAAKMQNELLSETGSLRENHL